MVANQTKLKKILQWALKQENGFHWVDLQNQFGFDSKEMQMIQHELRSNMPASENLVDHRYSTSIDETLLFVTNRGRSFLSSLSSEKSALSKIFHNPWMVSIGSIIIVAVLGGIIGGIFAPDKWLPFYYPNPSDLTTYSNGPIADTLEQCRDWIDAEAIRRGQLLGEYDYECGLNCKFGSAYSLFICEETVQ